MLAVGRFEAAEAACQRASRLARLIDDRLEFAVAERVAGSLAWARGRSDDAFVSWKLAAIAARQTCDERLELGRTYLEMGRFASDPVAGAPLLLQGRRAVRDAVDPALARAVGAGAASPDDDGRGRADPSGVAAARPPAPRAGPGRVLARDASGRDAGATGGERPSCRCSSPARRARARSWSRARSTRLSARAGKPFLAVNCGALRADLALSQLFGHRKGAFTGAHADGVGLVEAAHGGTLFLDEVGELPLDVQVTLLRFLESGEYMRLGETQVRRADVRIIAATNRELRGSDEKMFRRDLLFRLNEIEIRVPPLRDRREDIVPSRAALPRVLRRHRRTAAGARVRGTARDARVAGQRARARERDEARGGAPRRRRAGQRRRADALPRAADAAHERQRDADHCTTDDRASILNAYAEARGNKSRVAVLLGVSRKTLYARLKRLNLELP